MRPPDSAAAMGRLIWGDGCRVTGAEERLWLAVTIEAIYDLDKYRRGGVSTRARGEGTAAQLAYSAEEWLWTARELIEWCGGRYEPIMVWLVSGRPLADMDPGKWSGSRGGRGVEGTDKKKKKKWQKYASHYMRLSRKVAEVEGK